MKQDTRNKTIAFCSDNQTVVKANSFTDVNSRLVLDCLSILSQFGRHKRVALLWTLGHEGYQGNEDVERLTKEDFNIALIEPEPSYGIARKNIRSHIKRRGTKESRDW